MEDKRILVPIDEQNRRALEEAASANLDRLFSHDPDMPVRYDPPVHVPRRPAEPKYFHTFDRPRHRAVTKRRIYKSWGRWVILAGCVLCRVQAFDAAVNDKPRGKYRKTYEIVRST